MTKVIFPVEPTHSRCTRIIGLLDKSNPVQSLNSMPSDSLHIRQDASLRDIKAAFRTCYPFLKIEFFQRPHVDTAGSPRREMYSDKLSIRDTREARNDGVIKLHGDLTVSGLEAEFRDRFDLHVQVFRKSGRLWLETSVTDHWTLSQQNQHGAEAEEPPKDNTLTATSFDVQ
jgi:hypothetical protein